MKEQGSTMERRDFFKTLCAISLAGGAYGVGRIAQKNAAPPSSSEKAQTVFERVLSSGTLRCGYGDWQPLIWKDMASGEIKGIFYDYTMAIGRSLGLKIEWQATGWADYVDDLNARKIDVMAAGVWPVANVIKAADFTTPIFYVPIGSYCRADDARFDGRIELVNDPSVTIAALDGAIPARIAASDFPRAKVHALPQLESAASMLLSVVTGKADVTFTDRLTARHFMMNNPGKLREIPLQQPIRTFGNTIAVCKGEQELLNMLNFATDELVTGGEINRILDRYEEIQGIFLRLALPYQQ